MAEWPIKEVAQATGLTSRTLRYYEQIGLLAPSRVAHNGYRFYGDAELSRLYRILSLRALEIPLVVIKRVLAADITLTAAVSEQLELLEERRERTAQQIATVQHTLESLTTGNNMSLNDLFAGFDPKHHEAEARARWGDVAWQRSNERREKMSSEQLQTDDTRSRDITAALREVACAGVAPESEIFQSLVSEHYQWVTEQWGGRAPNREAYLGLANLYISDVRFAANYGGPQPTVAVRDAMQIWTVKNFSASDSRS